MKVNLLDFDADGLAAWFAQRGEKPFRARQVLRWMHRFGESDFDKMTDVAKSLRAKLAEINTRYAQGKVAGATPVQPASARTAAATDGEEK